MGDMRVGGGKNRFCHSECTNEARYSVSIIQMKREILSALAKLLDVTSSILTDLLSLLLNSIL